MDTSFSFVQPGIQAFYTNDNIPLTRTKTEGVYYFMLIIIEGVCKVELKDKIIVLRKNDVLLAHRKDFVRCNYSNSRYEILDFFFSSKFVNEYDKNYDMMKPFYDEDRFFMFKSLTTPAMKSAVNNMVFALKSFSSRAFVITAFMQIMCELNYVYEKKQKVEIKETDSSYAKIINYIDNHLFEKFTLADMSERVFLSSSSICIIIKQVTGLTYHNFVMQRRIALARQSIIDTKEPLNKIAEICGFNTYSTFYRAYISVLGISPKEDIEKNNLR